MFSQLATVNCVGEALALARLCALRSDHCSVEHTPPDVHGKPVSYHGPHLGLTHVDVHGLDVEALQTGEFADGEWPAVLHAPVAPSGATAACQARANVVPEVQGGTACVDDDSVGGGALLVPVGPLRDAACVSLRWQRPGEGSVRRTLVIPRFEHFAI